MTIPCECCPTTVTRCVRLVAPAFARDLGSAGRAAGPGSSTFTFTNFAGSGVDVVVAANGGNNSGSLGLSGGATDLATGINGSVTSVSHISLSFSAPVYLRSFGIADLDSNAQEQASNFVPQLSGVSGQFALFAGYGICPGTSLPGPNPLGVIRGTVINAVGKALFPGPLVTTLDFDICRQAGAGQFLENLAFDTVNPHDAITLLHCSTGNVWYDTAANIVNPNDYEDC